MLLEHKLHATRLQSEVAVLSNEKIATEKVVEELLEEISRFEEGVSTLESEMHQVCDVQLGRVVVLLMAGLHSNSTYFIALFYTS